MPGVPKKTTSCVAYLYSEAPSSVGDTQLTKLKTKWFVLFEIGQNQFTPALKNKKKRGSLSLESSLVQQRATPCDS